MKNWYEIWGSHTICPTRPFRIEGDRLVHSSGALLKDYREPVRDLMAILEVAYGLGAIPVRQWTSMWGNAVALVIPGADSAWFLFDDWKLGRFEAIGAKIIEDVVFGDKTRFYWSDEEGAAKFALGYGIRKKLQDRAQAVMTKNPPFPYQDKKLARSWGKDLSDLEYHRTAPGMARLQQMLGVDPITVMAAMDTVAAVERIEAEEGME